jgi:death on curing protein
MRLLLLENGYDIKATQEEKYEFVIAIASGKSDFEDICNWLNKITQKSNRH